MSHDDDDDDEFTVHPVEILDRRSLSPIQKITSYGLCFHEYRCERALQILVTLVNQRHVLQVHSNTTSGLH